MRKMSPLWVVLMSTSALAFGGQALAQESKAPAAEATELGEVIVTAQRREERLHDVPLAVSVVSGDQLAKSNYSQVTDLQFISPGVQYNANFGGGFQVRGVGTQSLLMTAEQSVAVVIDDIIQGLPETSFSGPTYQALVDLDRVEVLKGPQGTLFGKNSSAGVLQLVTKRPQLGVFAGDFSAAYGTDDETKVEANLNIPLGDTLAARFSVYQHRREGFVRNAFSKDDLSAYNRYGVRAKVLWTPTEALSVYAIGEYKHQYDNGNGIWTLRNCGSGFNAFSPCTELAKYGVTPGPKNLAGAWEGFIGSKQESRSGSVKVDYDLGWATITSITGYRSIVAPMGVDTDSTPRPILTVNRTTVWGDQFTQELRLAGEVGMFDYTLGGFYYDVDVHQDNAFGGTLGYLPDSSPILLSNGAAGRIRSGKYNIDATTQSTALFGQVTANVSDQLKIIGGLRYTKDKVDQSLYVVAYPGFCQINYAFGAPCQSVTLPSTPELAKVEADDVSGKITVKYAFNDDINVYASYGTGYKGPMIANPIGFPLLKVRPETSTSYELGLKALLFDNRLELNADVFHVKYKDFQGQTRVTDPGPPPISNYTTQNAGGLKTSGVEADLTFRATPELTLSANVAYQPTKFEEFSVQCYDRYANPGTPVGQCNYIKPGALPGAAAEFNAKGYPLIQSPKVQYALRADYARPVGDNMLVDASLNWSWRDKFYTLVADPNTVVKAYGLLGGSIGYGREDGKWRVSLFGRNLLDKYYVAGIFRTPLDAGTAGSTPLSTIGYSNIPSVDSRRTIGVKLDIAFGE